jgi:type IV pilus secretin PilQ/predicted competence protein
MRMIWRGLGLSAVVAASLFAISGNLRAADQPVVHVKTVVKDGGVRLEAQATGPFDYTSYRPSSNLLVLDLSGVSAGDPAGARIVPSDLVKSYRLVPFAEGEKSMVRLEVLLAQGIEPQVEKTDSQDLVLTVNRGVNPTSVAPSAAPSIVPTSAKSADTPDAVGLIRNVTVTDNAGKTDVTVIGSSTLDVHSMRLANPDRLVLDFPSARVASPKRVASNLQPVREVRVAQFTPETSRVVVDMRQDAAYEIHSSGNTVTVSFASGTAATPAAAPASQPASDLSTAQNRSSDGAPEVARVSDVPAPSVALPRQLTQPSAALGAQDGGQIQMGGVMGAMSAAQSQGSAPASASSSTAPANSTIGDSSAPAASPLTFAGGAGAAATPPASTKYTGDPISVNLKDVDLADFFRLIHEISGLNVVVDPSVKGQLTIVLDNVPWDQALDLVLKNNDLDKQLDGNVLRIATRATLKAEAQEMSDLSKAQAEAADVVTTTRQLSYAKATTIATTLKKFLSSRGDILADDRSNTLIIRDIPATFPVIDNLLRQLDRKSKQVEIEARVVEADRSFDREIGTILGAQGSVVNSKGVATNTFGGDPLVASATGSTTASTIPLLTNLPASAPSSGIQYTLNAGKFALDATIDALESKGVGKLLSQPKIITQNNEKGTAKDGTKIPVQTVVNNTVSVQFVDVVLEIDVTPQITADGTVYMDVTVENDQIDNGIPEIQGIPAITTQSVETKVTVNDGATVVLGGMYVTNQQTQINDVPVIGSVPIIGNLFKHTIVSSKSDELFFFITPRILPS